MDFVINVLFFRPYPTPSSYTPPMLWFMRSHQRSLCRCPTPEAASHTAVRHPASTALWASIWVRYKLYALFTNRSESGRGYTIVGSAFSVFEIEENCGTIRLRNTLLFFSGYRQSIYCDAPPRDITMCFVVLSVLWSSNSCWLLIKSRINKKKNLDIWR